MAPKNPQPLEYATPTSHPKEDDNYNFMAIRSLTVAIFFSVLTIMNVGFGMVGLRIAAPRGAMACLLLICPLLSILLGVLGIIKSQRGLSGLGTSIIGMTLSTICILLLWFRPVPLVSHL